MAVTPSTLRLQGRLQALVNATVDQQTRDLTAAWIRAWDEVAPDLQATLEDILSQQAAGTVVAKTLMVRSERLHTALAAIARQLSALSTRAGVRILTDIRSVVDASAAAQASIIGSQLPPGETLAAAGQAGSALDAIVARTAQQVTSLMVPLAPAAYDAVQRELLRGVVIGASPRHTAARMLQRAEVRFNGGLARALNISRTETLDAHRAAAQATQAQHAEVLAGWVWLTKLDVRTCPACIGMAGSLHSLEEPGPLGHQQCRCSRMPQTKTWRQLGFDVDEPPSALPDPDTWFENLSAAEQRKLLGPSRYKAWSAGDYPRSAWAQQKQNPGWRDSVVPSSPPRSEVLGVKNTQIASGSGGSILPPSYDTTQGGDDRSHRARGLALGTPPPESDRTAAKAYWQTRQDLLPVDFGGDHLYPHEVEFVERFLDTGQQLQWIPRTPGRPTNDFLWVSNGSVPTELKSTKAKGSTIHGRIVDAASRAARSGVVKDRFIVDLGDHSLAPDDLARLADFNVGRRKYRLKGLWLMSGGRITEVPLNE